jgi:acyl-homoserine lactone acylase PvdQ
MFWSILALLASIVLYSYLGQPATSGSVRVGGLNATLRRDEHGIPYIRGRTPHDAYFGLGLAMAQDQMFSLVKRRAIARGELAAFAGEFYLEQDILYRALGLASLAENMADTLRKEHREAYEQASSFCEGVNYYLSSRTLKTW